MSRAPVQDDTNVVSVAVADECTQLVWRAIPRSDRIESRRLIAPRRVPRVLGDGHQLEVREAELTHMRDKKRRELYQRGYSLAVASP